MDLHTHTIASGHGTNQTITDLARKARERRMGVLGISDHGPATPASCKEAYFNSLKQAPRYRFGVRILYGIEVNILDEQGKVDVSDKTLKGLDYAIAGIHIPTFHTRNYDDKVRFNTEAYIHAMENPYIKIIGHPDDARFPVDALKLAEAAAKYHVILEINDSSLSPEGYRGNTRSNMKRLLTFCLKLRQPVLLSSDSHGSGRIGEVPYALELVKELSYPRELILNYQPAESFLTWRPTPC